jgi:transposase-like protein
MVEEMLAARGISVTPETIRQWGHQIPARIRQPHSGSERSPW